MWVCTLIKCRLYDEQQIFRVFFPLCFVQILSDGQIITVCFCNVSNCETLAWYNLGKELPKIKRSIVVAVRKKLLQRRL